MTTTLQARNLKPLSQNLLAGRGRKPYSDPDALKTTVKHKVRNSYRSYSSLPKLIIVNL